jgi:hypothetical protein
MLAECIYRSYLTVYLHINNKLILLTSAKCGRRYTPLKRQSVSNEIAWHYIPESCHLHTCYHKNLKYKIVFIII